jgi:uncharacterized protein YdeI (YjbR/CyaY-like superfamily)
MEKNEIETFCPAGRKEWRLWLQKNQCCKQSVWLVCYKKRTNMPTVNWSEAVDEALCFGWIDSKRIAVDDDKFMQFFTKRKPGGTWSKVNKEKIRELVAAGLITKTGYESIAKAKQNGSWTMLDEVEELIIPIDLQKGFKGKNGSMNFFLSLSKSVKKGILQWLLLAKRPETRKKRISEITALAAQQKKPNNLDKPINASGF